jgi:phage gp37-like protein
MYAAIEDAIIARLQAANDSGALGYRLAQVASYGGEFDDETFFTQFRKFPAAWVTIGGSKAKAISARKTLLMPVIAVMVGTRNVRGERQTRHGVLDQPGSYQLLDDVRRLLAGQTFDLAIEPLSVGADRTLFNVRRGSEALSVLAAEFSTRFTFGIDEETASLPDMTSLNLRYFLKPGDDVEDATDVITLGH